MVDVSAKPVTARRAVAIAFVRMSEKTANALRTGATPKGDVLAAARIAGIMAAKRTPELIPLCHTVSLAQVSVELIVEESGVTVRATALAMDRTGVEMEALVAVTVAGLTVYDMLKSVDRSMVLERAMLVEKSGGRSGHWTRGGA